MLTHEIAHRLHGVFRDVRARVALRGVSAVGSGLRTVGAPHVEATGRVRFGRNVTLICEPEPVRIVALAGAEIEIGDDVEIGSGCVLVASRRVTIERGARLGSRCRLIDAAGAAAGEPIVVGEGAVLTNETELSGGSRVAAGAYVRRAGAEDLQGTPVSAASGTLPRTPSAPVAQPHEPVESPVNERGAARDALAPIIPGVKDAAPDQPLRNVAGWDSLASIHALVALEARFKVALPSDFFDKNPTLEHVTRALAARAGVA